MVGSCPLGRKTVCPPGHEESRQVHVRSADDCRCVPFFLLGDLDRSATGPQLLERLSLENDVGMPIEINIKDVKLKLGSKTCTCSFLFTVTSNHQVLSSSGRCDKKCSGRGKGVEVTGSLRTLSFDLTVKKGKAKITNPTVIDILTTTTTTTTPGQPQTTNAGESTSMPSTDSGCLCVDQGPSTQDQLTFNEAGETHVQEQIFIEETGILGNFHRKKKMLICFPQRYTSLHTATTPSRCTWCQKAKFCSTQTSPASCLRLHRISAKGF